MPSKKSSSPYIRDETSVPKLMWTVVLALLPSVFTSLIFFGFHAFRTLTVAMATALLAEMGMRKIFRKRVSLYDGSAVITSLLFTLFLPPALPSWMVALGSLFAIVVGKEIFGGLGQNPFNPALVGVAFLLVSFPVPHPFLPAPLDTLPMTIYALAIFLGGVLLIVKRLIDWEIPLLYLGALLLFDLTSAGGGRGPIFLSSLLLAAFFVVTDPVTTPLTRWGDRWFALGAGFLTAALRQGTSAAEAVTYGVLLMNGLTPWLDQWFRPHRERG